MDNGKKERLLILERDFKNRIQKFFDIHHWALNVIETVEDGEYLLVSIKRGDVQYKIAYMYTSATANNIYKRLDSLVDVIVINGDLYHIDSFAYGINTPVVTREGFIPIILKWNDESTVDGFVIEAMKKPEVLENKFPSHIQSNEPIKEIWRYIKQFQSQTVAESLVKYRMQKVNMLLDDEIISQKAIGVSFSLRNAYDCFQPNQNLNQRVVNYYYGIIALASAEMLVNPYGPKSLGEVEEMTKYGHGLYTIDGEGNNKFENLFVGVLSNGFYKKWMDELCNDTSFYPAKKPKSTKDINDSNCDNCRVIDLFARIPEVESIFKLVTDSPFKWLDIHYDSEGNPYTLEGRDKSYVILNDLSCSMTPEDIKMLPYEFKEIQYSKSDNPGLHYRVAINHEGKQYWHEAVSIHRSPFVPSRIIVPLYKNILQFRAIIACLLYALSIIVRYRPSIWRNIQNGEYEKYGVLIETLLDVVERIIPEEFLSAIIDQVITVTQPDSLFSRI